MSEKLVRIATPSEIERYVFRALLSNMDSVKKHLEEDGFILEKLIHFLLHDYCEINGRGDKGYRTLISLSIERGGSWGLDVKDYYKGLRDLEQIAKKYLSTCRAHYLAITYPRAYNRVAGVFEDLGCRVERLQPTK